jgi:hypothetical protein
MVRQAKQLRRRRIPCSAHHCGTSKSLHQPACRRENVGFVGTRTGRDPLRQAQVRPSTTHDCLSRDHARLRMTHDPLIHPPRFITPAVPLARIVIRRNVVPMLVEVDLAVMLRHVNFKLLRRAPPLPAVIRISHAVISLRETNVHQRWLRPASHVKPAEQ